MNLELYYMVVPKLMAEFLPVAWLTDWNSTYSYQWLAVRMDEQANPEQLGLDS